jgi:hypothetical protein
MPQPKVEDELPLLGNIYFGDPELPALSWRDMVDAEDDDDEVEKPTPHDVVKLLGFDPAVETQS